MPTLPGIEILLQEAMILDLADVSVGIKGVESSSPLISIFSSEDMYLTARAKWLKILCVILFRLQKVRF